MRSPVSPLQKGSNIFVPRLFDREKLGQKYRCPSCAGFVRIDDEKCQHCNTVFTETARNEMRNAYDTNATESVPYLLTALAVSVAIVLFVIALVSLL
jgi:hypothetical protein